MALSMSLLLSVFTLLLIIVVGYGARKYNILSKDSVLGISKFVLCIALPSLILVSSTSQKFSIEDVNLIYLLVISSIIYYILSIIISLLAPYLICSTPEEIGIHRFILVFPSAVFFAFPLIEIIFGKSGIFYAAIFNLPYFLLTFSLGIWLMTSSLENQPVKKTFDPRKLLNPAFLATILGLFLYFALVSIPEPIHGTLEFLGKMATPLALITTGGFLYEVNLFSLFKNIHHYLVSLLRLIILPLIVFAALNFISDIFVLDMPAIVLAIAVIIASMPAAVQTVIIASEYEANPEIAAEIILITTIFAAVTIPLIMLITGILV